MIRVAEVEALIGQTIERISLAKDSTNYTVAVVINTRDTSYLMFHQQDCCEQVYLEDTIGKWQHLAGKEIVHAEETTKERAKEEGVWWTDSSTWTFYNIRSTRGDVTMRWLGVSNGYYSEAVDMVQGTSDEIEEYLKSYVRPHSVEVVGEKNESI